MIRERARGGPPSASQPVGHFHEEHVVAARPDHPVVQILCSANVGGVVGRRMLIVSILLPFVLLLFYDAGRDSTLLDARVGRSLLAVVIMVTMSALALFTATTYPIVTGTTAAQSTSVTSSRAASL